MERACVENVAVMWLTGNEHPDHNTLWRFFRDNKEAIRKVLKQSVKVAADANLIGMVLHAVDGTKIEAQASCKTAYYREKLDKALERADATPRSVGRRSARAWLSSTRLAPRVSNQTSRMRG
jgi:DNA-binding phage protein